MSWSSGGANTFEAFCRFLIQSDDTGAPIGTDNIRLFLTLADGTRTGTFKSQIKDLSDTVIFEASGDYAASPVSV